MAARGTERARPVARSCPQVTQDRGYVVRRRSGTFQLGRITDSQTATVSRGEQQRGGQAVNLINWDGLAILGPGSEWFWSMAQFVAVAATLAAIYKQLRVQRASSLYDQSAAWTRDWNNEHLSLSRVACLLDLVGRPVDSGLPPTAVEPGEYFERLGYLVAQGHLRSADVWHDMRGSVGRWWKLMAPYVSRDRTTYAHRALYEWFEKLELELRRLDRKMIGRELEFDVSDEALRKSIDESISRLRLHADAKNGIFPSRRVEPAQPSEA